MSKSKCASEFQQVNDNLYVWSLYDPEVKTDLWCTLIKTPSGLVIIDPVPLADEAWTELLALGPLRAILITSGNHARSALPLRDFHHVPIVTAPETRREFTEFKADVVLLPNELLYGIAAIAIPGATPGETAFFTSDGVMVIGDAVINVSTEKGIELLPDKYCTDAAQNRESLKTLLAFDFHTLTFAHGAPVTTRAKDKMQALLNS